jgi:galactitol-specific phosphotransferase system IIC component
MNQILIQNILIGFILGFLGQAIRIVVGLKKWNDDKSTNGDKAEPFSAVRFIISIILGMVAGALASIAAYGCTQMSCDSKVVLSLIAAGYAGADFIDGFITKYLPKPNP